MTRYPLHNVIRRQDANGNILLTSGLEMGEVVADTNIWLRRRADEMPDRMFIAARMGDGWKGITYGEAWEQTRATAQALLDRGIKGGDSVVVLSGPSVAHAVLMQACQMIGAVIVPLAEQYSLIPEARSRLAYCAEKVRAAMVCAFVAGDDAATPFAEALALPVFDNAVKCTALDDLLTGKPGAGPDAAYATITPDTIAKILFTSGSTSNPKAVPNTQRMLCVNQAQYLACIPVFGERHHTVLDWLPWNHTFAGNSNFNMTLANGMSLYLDDGKPLPGRFERSIENSRMLKPTLRFDVPIAHALMVAAMRDDAELRHRYFAELDLFFYAGASLPADIWQAIEEMAMAERGEIPLMTSSWGMTETAPACIIMHEKGGATGNIGVPMPQVEAKLLPLAENRFELRCKGPNVFTGYLDDPERNKAAFDAEGFFITGDAVGMLDADDITRGLFFDGRVSEDFKLITGTWVQASTLRLEILPRLGGLVRDIVICGEGRNEVGMLIFAPEKHAGGDNPVCTDAGLMDAIAGVLGEIAAGATGSSRRIARALIMTEPPSMGDGEITAKGSLNINAILQRRADLLAMLYDDACPAVIKPAVKESGGGSA